MFFLLICILPCIVNSAPSVKTSDGTVVGTTYQLANGRALDGFFGIPYAEAPIGDRRFEAPQPKKPWDGEWNAMHPRLPCNQFYMPDKNAITLGDEDCLYLNVFRPQKVNTGNSSLNVLVYIIGGAFVAGSTLVANPDYIMQYDDFIFVTMNYRLGPLGFISTNDEAAPGNNGLKDQVLALQWVQKNIGYFGGDPNKVTIYGISSGGSCAHLHLFSPLTDGLFQKAISSSGSALAPWTLPPNVVKNSFDLAFTLNCSTENTQSMMQCLKQKSVNEIFDAMKFLFVKWNGVMIIPFGPVIEPNLPNAFLTENPHTLLENAKVKKVPLLISMVKNEGTVPGIKIVADDNNLKEVNDNWNEIAPDLFAYSDIKPDSRREEITVLIKQAYFGNEDISKETAERLLQAIGDRLHSNAIVKSAKLHASAAGNKAAYCYKFNFRGQESFCDYFDLGRKYANKVCHSDDQFYIVNYLGLKPKRSIEDENMSKFLARSVIAFMKKGDPNIEGTDWKPLVANGEMNCLNIYSSMFREMKNIENEDATKFWNDILPNS